MISWKDTNAIARAITFNKIEHIKIYQHLKYKCAYYADHQIAMCMTDFAECQVCHTNTNDQNLDQLVQKVKKLAKQYTPNYMFLFWEIHPYTTPQNLGLLLQKNGYKLAETTTCMAVDIDEMITIVEKNNLKPKDKFSIVEVKTHEQAMDIGDVFVKSYEVPEKWGEVVKRQFLQTVNNDWMNDKWILLLGYATEKKIPVSCMLLCFAAGVVGIHYSGTLKEFRRKGYNTALRYHALKEAKKRGYHVAVSSAKEKTRKILERLGWKRFYEKSKYLIDSQLHDNPIIE